MLSRRHRRLTHLTLASLASAALIAGGCDGNQSAASQNTADIVPASVRTFEIATRATGELEARDRVELRSGVERQTSIVEIIGEGTRVEAGTVLVRLNSDEIQREIEEEELQRTEARLQLESAEAAYEIQISDNATEFRKAELAIELAELALNQWERGDHEKRMKQLTTSIEKTERDLNRLRDKVIKSKELFEKEFLSKDEYELDQIRLLEAEAAFETAKLDLEVYRSYEMKRERAQKESDLAEAKQDLDRVEKSNEINLKNKASQRENRAVQLGRREERLENYKKQLEACTVIAPRSGLVVYGTTSNSNDWRAQQEGGLAIGRQVYPNELLIVLPDTSEMMASVKVHESLAGRIRPGQTAQVKIDAAGGVVVPGKVESIGVLAESGGWRDPNRREYTVRIAVEAGDHSGDIKPSMRCEAEIILGTVEEALSVPVQAVFSDGGVRYVYVAQGQRFAKKPVQLGRRSDLFAEITAGLEANDRVLIRQPSPGEVIAGDWDEGELTAAGYTTDENGNILTARSGRPMARASRSEATVTPAADKTADTDGEPEPVASESESTETISTANQDVDLTQTDTDTPAVAGE
jgi:HlyD family secretion protein